MRTDIPLLHLRDPVDTHQPDPPPSPLNKPSSPPPLHHHHDHQCHPRCPNLTYLDVSNTDVNRGPFHGDADNDDAPINANASSRFTLLGGHESACRRSLTYLNLSGNRLSRNVLRSLGKVQVLVILLLVY